MKVSPIPTIILALSSFSLPACNKHREPPHPKVHKVVATSPQSRAVTFTEQYAGQIQSYRHLNVCALEKGYISAIAIKEGQAVKKGDLMFTVTPMLQQKNAQADLAEANLSQRDFNYSAPFDGIVDQQQHQKGNLVQEGDVLTTLSDNSVIWVYFNVPEARYLEFMAKGKDKQDPQIELVLANGEKFEQTGKMGAIEGGFNTKTGNISFRADFPNPDRLLRHGQTGQVLIHRVQNDAIVIPQRATFELLTKRYVFVIDKDGVAHEREVGIQNELEDSFVIKKGLGVDDKIILDGIGHVRDGDKVEYADRQPEPAAAKPK